MQVIPAIDVLDGRIVRLMRGDYEAVTNYEDDPVAVAVGFHEQGAELVHVVDLDAARGRERSHRVIRDLAAAGIPFQVGGGIRTAEIAEAAVSAGARRVVVGSALLGPVVDAGRLIDAVGPSAVVAAIDVRDGRARGSGWLDEGLSVAEFVRRLDDLGVERALVTGIETDGTMEGPAFDLFSRVRGLAPNLALIASGGVGSLDDIRALGASDIGLEAVIVGRALYEGRFTLKEAMLAASEG